VIAVIDAVTRLLVAPDYDLVASVLIAIAT